MIFQTILIIVSSIVSVVTSVAIVPVTSDGVADFPPITAELIHTNTAIILDNDSIDLFGDIETGGIVVSSTRAAANEPDETVYLLPEVSIPSDRELHELDQPEIVQFERLFMRFGPLFGLLIILLIALTIRFSLNL
jgi:hypothetical protein